MKLLSRSLASLTPRNGPQSAIRTLEILRGDMCLWVNQSVGRMTALLKELGFQDNALVIFTSDHGPSSKRFNGGMREFPGSVRMPRHRRVHDGTTEWWSDEKSDPAVQTNLAIGLLALQPGRQRIFVRALGIPGEDALELQGIRLHPLP